MLSWEEFLEVHQEALPKPHWSSLVAMILMAIATGAFGALLVYFIDSRDRLVASTFCWLSFLLLLAAFWDFKIRRGQRTKRVLQELRSTYDRHYGSEQVFAFDSDRWTHRTEAAKYEASWSSLLHAIEKQNVITLSAKSHLVTLPKRLFDDRSSSDVIGTDASESLALLRRLMFGQNENPWQFRLGFADYLFTEIASLWRTHPFLMYEAHAGGLLWCLMVASGMYHSTGPGVVWGWTIAGSLLFLTITAQLWYFLLKYATPSNALRIPWEAEFSDRGAHVKNPRIEYFSAWSAFRKFREGHRSFLLYVDSRRYSIFPKRCLSLGQQATLRKLLTARVATN